MASNVQHPFKGRSVSVVNDLTAQEQRYLYQKARALKYAVLNGKPLDEMRLGNRDCCVYSIFMEDSTRTKESFRNAAEFHGMKVNMFDAKTSSFQKNETITDTIKMLVGYSIGQTTFVVRSQLEGTCTWLQEAIGDFTERMGYPKASFVNAGDGKHEHPSQELLDEFSFLEHKGWDESSIHVALLGDLFHGRTVHSKVDGLRIYGQVEVDLVAPEELQMPKIYEDRMLAAGFIVRKFPSIAEYLAQPKVSKIWYFTRLQLERMGDEVLSRAAELRRAVTFQREFVERLPPNTKFFHPLPRDAKGPTIPFWLDDMELNGWDQQSRNGYFVRIVLLGMLSGHFGSDYDGPTTNGAEAEKRSKTSSEVDAKGLDAICGAGFAVEVKEELGSEAPGGCLADGLLVSGLPKDVDAEAVRAILGAVGEAPTLLDGDEFRGEFLEARCTGLRTAGMMCRAPLGWQ